MEAAEPQAQQLLWGELVQGCRRALELAAEQDKQQGQLHEPRVSHADVVLFLALLYCQFWAMSARLSVARTARMKAVNPAVRVCRLAKTIWHRDTACECMQFVSHEGCCLLSCVFVVCRRCCWTSLAVL